MAVLIVFPHDPPGAGAGRTPLEESLESQTSGAWYLAAGPGTEVATGDIIVHLPIDARLHPRGCQAVLDAFAQHPDAVALYGDLMVGNTRQARPAWSPTRVQSEPGACLPLAIRAGQPQLDPHSHPLELERTLAGSNAQVLHLPSPLTSHPAQPELLQQPVPDDPRFEPGPRPGTFRRRPSPSGQASVSIIIPSAGFNRPGTNEPMLARCLETLSLLDPPPVEILVVVGDEYQGELPQAGPGLPVQVVHRGRGSFDYSRSINCGLLASRGELVLLLNDDTEAESPDWLGRMAAHMEDPSVGAVGAALVYPDRTVQHVGVVFDDGHPLHPFRNHRLSDTSEHGGDVARDVIAVTGACLLARRADLLTVGGMSPSFPLSFSDIDLCLRLRQSGLRVMVEPAAVLTHHESASREPAIEPWEHDRFTHRWGEVEDPWYHPAFWRPNDPDAMTRNTDHLEPVDRDRSWPARTTAVGPGMLQARINPRSSIRP